MKEGSVALAALPQTDRQIKLRPIIILRKMPTHGDLLVCGVSSRTESRAIRFDELISPSDIDFPSSGLLKESLVRLGFLAVIARKEILGSIGFISPDRHLRLLHRLSSYLVAR